MRIAFQFITVFLILTRVTASAYADDDEKAIMLDTIVVTAKKPDQPLKTGDVDTEETSASVVVIKREAFEGKMEGIDEVIEKETGIQVRQSGGLGSYSSVSLRGSTSDQVMLFLDGILLNDASGKGLDLSTISLSDVESIEIYKGSAPVNFGKSSIGGVVNIKTIRSREEFDASISVGYGSFGTQRANGLINHKPGRFDYLISAEALSSDNDYEIENDKGTQYNPDDDTTENRNNAQFDLVNAMGKAGYDFTDNRRIDILHQYFSKDQGLPSWNNAEETKTSLTTERNITTLKLTDDGIGGLPLNAAAFVDYTHKEEEYDDSEGHIGLGDQRTRYFTERYGVNLFLEWPGEYQTLSLMMDMHREDYEAEDLLHDTDTNESRRVTFSTGLQDTIYCCDEALVLLPAVRYSHTKDELADLIDAWGISGQEASRTHEYWSPQIGLTYQPATWLKFKSNLGKYFRDPHFYELSGDRGYLIGNPDLETEKGTNFDIGLTVNTPSQQSWLHRFFCSATYFSSDVDDLITTVYDARGIGRAVNIPGARINGIEFGVKADCFEKVRLIANTTIQETENLNEDKAFEGKKLPGRWGQSYLGRIEATLRGIKVYSEYLLSEDLYYDTANLLEAEDKKEFNAGVSWLWDHWLFIIEAKNIQDNQYEDFNGYPLPGRSFFGSVTYKY